MEGLIPEPTIKTLAETGSSDVQGSSVGTKYGLQPILYLKEIIDAAKKQLFFAQFARVIRAPEGTHDVVIPKRSKFHGASGVTFDTSERTSADISWTTLDTVDSVIATPAIKLAGYAITKFALRTNALNLLNIAKEELSYAIGDKVDAEIAVALGDATAASSTAAGAQTIYGGDATSDSTLSDGDVITTDIVAKAARYLKDTQCRYWSGGTEGISSATKNPWMPTPDEPFVLFIHPCGEEAFRKDPQFVSAAEYGSNEVVMNGEIGQYLGIKIIVTPNVETVASGSTGPDGTTASADMYRAIMMKAKRAVALVWGQEPELQVFEYPNRDQIRIKLVCAYDIKVIHDDAIVWIDVSQK